jgi:actin-related protein
MEAIYRHIFEELKVNPKEHPVLLTESPLNPISNRIRTAEMMFETFGVPSLFFQSTAVLSLYARGMMTGVVLDVGDGVSSAAAIYEGYSIRNATQRIDLGGRDVTQHLMQLLRRAGYAFQTTAEFEICKQIKEKYCYVEPMNSRKEDFSAQ